MVPPAMRQQPHVSFTQIDQYLRCPLKYKFTYVDRQKPEFVPAALAFGSGIHGAAAFLFSGVAAGTPPALDEVQGYFESYWALETEHKPIRFGERDTNASLLDLARRMLEVLYRDREPGTEIVGVEQPFDVPLIDLDTGEVLDRALVGTLDLIERDAEGRAGRRGSQDVSAEVHEPPDRGLAAIVRLQLRDGDERPRRPGGPAAPVRRADQDEAAGALPLLDPA